MLSKRNVVQYKRKLLQYVNLQNIEKNSHKPWNELTNENKKNFDSLRNKMAQSICQPNKDHYQQNLRTSEFRILQQIVLI